MPALRFAAVSVLVAAAILTPGFLTAPSLLALLNTMSFVGCVAIGMTFITLSGNIMSFCLGATLSATTIVFMSSLPLGLMSAITLSFLFSAVLTGAQGFLIGYFRANPIIISMAATSLLYGCVTFLTGGLGVYPVGTEADVLKGRIGPLPWPVAAFLVSLIVAQLVLSYTRLGLHIVMVGSNRRAAEAAGIEPWRPIAWAYAFAGLSTAFAAVLMAARYGSGDMEHGIGYDYHAISAVLVGGSAIGGGQGSAVRTAFGALVIAALQGLLLLWGFSTQSQYLAIGVIILGVIMLQSAGHRA